MPIVAIKQPWRYLTGADSPHWEDSFPWIQLAILLALNPAHGLALWLTIHAACSWFFITISLVAGTHHSDEIWHEGDKAGSMDFGIMQIEATRDRHHTLKNAAAVFFFGDHVCLPLALFALAVATCDELIRPACIGPGPSPSLPIGRRGAAAAAVSGFSPDMQRVWGYYGRPCAVAIGRSDRVFPPCEGPAAPSPQHCHARPIAKHELDST